METETKTENVVVDVDNEGEGEVETISVSKKDYDVLNQTLGSLKKQVKDYKKSLEKPDEKETPQTKSDNNQLLEKAFLRSAQITDAEEVELALSTAKKWGVSVDALVDDEDFKVKLEKTRTQKANTLATSNVKGSAGKGQVKDTPEYWQAKGTPPTPNDIPDMKTRQKVIKSMMAQAKGTGGNPFYNAK